MYFLFISSCYYLTLFLYFLFIKGVVPEDWLAGLFDVCSSGNYDKLSSYVDDMMAEGYAGAQVSATHIYAIFKKKNNKKQFFLNTCFFRKKKHEPKKAFFFFFFFFFFCITKLYE